MSGKWNVEGSASTVSGTSSASKPARKSTAKRSTAARKSTAKKATATKSTAKKPAAKKATSTGSTRANRRQARPLARRGRASPRQNVRLQSARPAALRKHRAAALLRSREVPRRVRAAAALPRVPRAHAAADAAARAAERRVGAGAQKPKPRVLELQPGEAGVEAALRGEIVSCPLRRSGLRRER